MNKKLKNKWVKSLRSSKYKQGRYELFDNYNDEYCCLGVLAQVAGVPTEKISHAGCYDILQKVGISAEVQNQFVEFNDLRRMSFNQIAKCIEQRKDWKNP